MLNVYLGVYLITYKYLYNIESVMVQWENNVCSWYCSPISSLPAVKERGWGKGLRKGVSKETLPNSIFYSITHLGWIFRRYPTANFPNLCSDFAANLARRKVLSGTRWDLWNRPEDDIKYTQSVYSKPLWSLFVHLCEGELFEIRSAAEITSLLYYYILYYSLNFKQVHETSNLFY